ncbi:MAG: PAS domain-containing protein [Thermodesulfovibrionales bacterium]|nr:PAS domain-containing protein [Thermodesulfovibrionales bacterium]
MDDQWKTKEQLITELKELREELALFKALSSDKFQIVSVLRDFKEIYDNFYKSNPHPMWIYDLKTLAFLDVNHAAIKHYGYSQEEFLSMTIKEIRPPEDIPALLENVSKVTEGLDIAGLWRHIKKNGDLIYVEIISHTLAFAGRQSEIVLAVDITERRRAEEAVRKNEERLESIFRASPSGIGLLRDRILLDINPRICEMTGYAKEELLGKSARIFYPTQEDFEYVGTEKYRQISERGTGVVETKWMKKDGTIIDVFLSSTPVDLHDLSKGVTFTALDITERKHSEHALKETEQKLRNIIEHSNELYYVYDTHHVLNYVSPQSLQVLGYTPEEMMIEWTKLMTDNPINVKGLEIAEKALRTGEKQTPYLLELCKKDGSTVLLEIDESPVKDDDGDVIAIVGAARNVTERMKAEEALKKSQEQIRMLLDSTAEAIYGIDLKGNCTFVNAACLSILGYDNEKKLLGENMHELIHHKYPDGSPYPREKCKIYQAYRENKKIHNDTEVFWRKDGSSFPVEYRSYPIIEKGVVIGSVVTFLDITERKKAEKEIENRVKELEDFYEIAVGRELRMIDLKEKIEKLEEKLAKYKEQQNS